MLSITSGWYLQWVMGWPLSDSTEASYLAEEFMIQVLESQVQSPYIKAIGDNNVDIAHHNDFLGPMNCGDFTCLTSIQNQMVHSAEKQNSSCLQHHR